MNAGKVFVLLLAGAALGAGIGAALWFAPASATGATPPSSTALPNAPITAAPAPVVGAPAPDFSLADLQGRTLTLSSLRGRTVLVNFWATWCDPCREELPLLDRIARKYPDALRVIGVETGDPADAVRSFAEPLGLTALTLVLDPAYAARDLYLVRGLPTSFFIDSGGAIRKIKIGALDSSEIDSILASMGVAS
jgi:cytochrome c biogenesis protein CcmG, thiol:disulfide interchange protein DsbE